MVIIWKTLFSFHGLKKVKFAAIFTGKKKKVLKGIAPSFADLMNEVRQIPEK